MIYCKPMLFFGATAIFAGSAWAASPIGDAAQAAMGGTAAASFDDNASMSTNPSLVALEERYDLGAHGRLGDLGANEWGLSIVDARTSGLIGMGVMYRGRKSEPALTTKDLPGWTIEGESPSNVRRRHDVVAALGTHFAQRRVAVGLSGSLLFYDHDRQGQGTTGNLDAGISAHLLRWMVAGVSGRNLLPFSHAGDLPASATLGVNMYGSAGVLRADVDYQVGARQAWTAAAGVQRMLGEIPALRLGYRYSGPDGGLHRVSTGLGLIGPDGSFDLGVMLPVGQGNPSLQNTTLVASVLLGAPNVNDPLGPP